MLKLMVSYDCGVNYECDMESNNINDFDARTKQFDKDMLRWCIKDENNNNVGRMCGIHQGITDFFEKVRGK